MSPKARLPPKPTTGTRRSDAPAAPSRPRKQPESPPGEPEGKFNPVSFPLNLPRACLL